MNHPRPAPVAVAGLLALAVLGQGIGARFTKDAEPQSAQWIADIVQNGHWLLPRDYYGFVNRKPPLYYWLSALGADATGGRLDEVRARAVSLIAGVVLAVTVLEWTAGAIGPPAGWMAFFFLMGSYGFASRATTALTDMLMSCLLFGAYILIYPITSGGPDRGIGWRRIAAIGVLLGLAILTKGPVVIVLIGFALLLYYLLIEQNPLAIAFEAWPWATVTIAIVIAALWYVPAFAVGRDEDLAGVFLSENFGHFMPASMGGTGEAARPVYYIVLRLVGGMLPLILLLPALVMAFWERRLLDRARKPLLFQLALALAIVLFFSAASAKRDDYILPAIAPLAILFAALFTATAPYDEKSRPAMERLRDGIALVIAVLMLAGAVGGVVIWRASDLHWLSHLQSSDASYAAIFANTLTRSSLIGFGFITSIVLGAVVVLVGVWRRQPFLTGGGLAALCLVGTLLWTAIVRPGYDRTHSVAEFAAEVRTLTVGAPVYVAYFDPEFAWYYGRGAPPLPRAIARGGAPSDEPVFLVARQSELARLAPPVRSNLRTITRSASLGGAGPPALYELAPSSSAATSLKAGH